MDLDELGLNEFRSSVEKRIKFIFKGIRKSTSLVFMSWELVWYSDVFVILIGSEYFFLLL